MNSPYRQADMVPDEKYLAEVEKLKADARLANSQALREEWKSEILRQVYVGIENTNSQNRRGYLMSNAFALQIEALTKLLNSLK